MQIDRGRVKKLSEALSSASATTFRTLLSDVVHEVFENAHAEEVRKLLHFAGFHYASQVLGKWARVFWLPKELKLEKKLALSSLEVAQHEAAYEDVPQELSMATWRFLRRPWWIRFAAAGTTTNGVSMETDSLAELVVPEEIWKECQTDIPFEGRNFYNVIYGLLAWIPTRGWRPNGLGMSSGSSPGHPLGQR